MHELLTQTVRAGIRLELQGDELQVSGPAHALTPELRAALQANKAALIENLRSLAEPSAPDALPELVADPAHAAEPFPLSDVQHAYWVGRYHAVESGQVATHFYCELDAGQADCGRIERALQRLIERHGMLRAVVDATGLQRVLAMFALVVRARWFRCVIAGVTIMATLFFVAHEIAHLLTGDMPFGMRHALDFSHHLLGIWVTTAAIQWARIDAPAAMALSAIKPA
ncbi:TubC N-terminal docking domain-related protein [Verminephrobacter aporrectodeae]|uniref:TubC N-terminal docking domain-related protein n=1 Tax=Verminephrobacter aporrectodeae TaxID=1110389 RepID=UPI002243CC1E|nr:hypothetical protein [Verminephrobacter aporrectodeae]